MTDPLTCLVAAIFFEARDQPIDGQIMVAQVVMNRKAHEDFPNTICSVVYEDRAFSFTHDGQSDDPADYTTHFDVEAHRRATEVALAVLEGGTTGQATNGPDYWVTSTHYHAYYVKPYWSDIFTLDGRVGDHVFFTCSRDERNC